MIAAFALAAGVTVLAFVNSFAVPFLFDDEASLLTNPTLTEFSAPWKILQPPANAGVGGRPVLNATFALNRALTGEAAWGYHAGNLLIHLAAGLCLFGALRRILLAPKLGGPLAEGASRLAFLIAVWWLVHPLQTAAVTYLSQRAESLMGLFYLATLYFSARSFTDAAWRWKAAAIASCWLGMGTKEVMVTAPVAVFFVDWLFFSSAPGNAWRARKAFYAALAGSWLLLVFLMRDLPTREVGTGFGVGPGSYLLTECRVVWHYAQLALWPCPLVFDYGLKPFADETVWPYAIAMAVGVVGAGYVAWRWPQRGIFAAGFFLLLAPTSSVVPIAAQPMAENRMYLPLAVVLAALVTWLWRWAGRKAEAVLSVVIGLSAALTFQRNATFRSEILLWADTIAKRPGNGRALTNLGVAHSLLGKEAEAVPLYLQALALNPADADACNNLGSALLALGEPGQARPYLEEAVRLRPSFAGAHYNLGTVLLRLGKVAESLPHFDAALRLQPTHAQAALNRGAALLLLGRNEEGAEALRLAVKLEPHLVEARANLGEALARLGRLEEALRELDAAIGLKPTGAGTYHSRGIVRLHLNRLETAAADFETALKLDPTHRGAAEQLRRLGREPARNARP